MLRAQLVTVCVISVRLPGEYEFLDPLIRGDLRQRRAAVGDRRVSGFTRARELLGPAPGFELIVDGTFSRSHGCQASRELLSSGRELTAVFAATDVIAAGVVQALREAGRRIPDDVAVAGREDIPLARDVCSSLTIVHVPQEEPGRAAVRLALHRDDLPDGRHLVLGPHVVLRDAACRRQPSDTARPRISLTEGG